MYQYKLGVKGLDEILGNTVYPGTLLVIAGHPGTGKTTLASTICYSNALNGHRCLYITFQETKEKLFRLLKNLGMDFSELEKQGLYTYTRLPVTNKPEEIVEFINMNIRDNSPEVIVIDSINVLLDSIDTSNKRAWLQNYFYSLPNIVNGIVVLIAEIPVNEERIDLGSIEFVADVVLILKHKVERGLLNRSIEIRKARNSPLTFVEIPFHITRNKGIEVFIPPAPRELPKHFGYYEVNAPIFKDIVGKIPIDGVIAYMYPPDARVYMLLLFLADIILRYKLKIMVISFIEHPFSLVKLIEDIGIVESKLDEGTIRSLLPKHLVVVESINPYSMTIEEIWMHLINMINEHKPNILLLHGLEVLYPVITTHTDSSFASVFNALQFVKSMGVLTVAVLSHIGEAQGLFLSLCNIILRIFYKAEDGVNTYLYVWKENSTPAMYKLDLEGVKRSLGIYLRDIILQSMEEEKHKAKSKQ